MVVRLIQPAHLILSIGSFPYWSATCQWLQMKYTLIIFDNEPSTLSPLPYSHPWLPQNKLLRNRNSYFWISFTVISTL